MAGGALSTLADLLAPATLDGHTWRGREETDDVVRRLAAGLIAVGVRPGDRVTWWLPNRWQGVALYLACWQVGAVAAPLHHRLSVQEAQALVARIAPRAIFVAHDLPHLRGAAAIGGPHDAWPVLTARAPLAGPVAPAPDGLATLLATSGSDGRPKLVAHTHAALLAKAQSMTVVHGLGAADTVLLPAPLAHISGLLNGVLLPAASGMRVVLVPRWDPGRALSTIADEAVTFVVGPPTVGGQLLAVEVFSVAQVASVRLYSCGGAGVTAAFAERAAALLDCVVKRTYGSTEAPTVTTSWVGDPVERGWHTDGRVTSGAQLRVDDAGELWLRGAELFARYWDDDSSLDGDGWFPTGDLAHLDGGWLTVTGRRKELIIRGGENVSPREVETVCQSLPGISDCAVVGYPDEIYGERVGLVVVGSTPTLDAVRAHCAAAGLARYKTPERVVGVAAMPTLTVGKPDRGALAEMLSASA